ncbi:MAG: hypothetical protein JRI68_10565 [Deltaproteobacteria bacterium]|nr:hypothetical protein [Deltaproteobacteria bacterium]
MSSRWVWTAGWIAAVAVLGGAAACDDSGGSETGGTGGSGTTTSDGGQGGTTSTGGTAGTAGTGGQGGGHGGSGGAGGAANHQLTFVDQAFTWEDGNNGAVTQLGTTHWLAPIDYFHGRIYLRYEVAQKPSELLVAHQVCVWQDSWSKETCSSCETMTGSGVYYRDLGSPASDWWILPNGDIDWSQPFQRVSVMHKVTNCSGELLEYSSCGSHCYSGNDLQDHIPITGHVTMIVVPAGETLVPPGDWTGCPSGWGC